MIEKYDTKVNNLFRQFELQPQHEYLKHCRKRQNVLYFLPRCYPTHILPLTFNLGMCVWSHAVLLSHIILLALHRFQLYKKTFQFFFLFIVQHFIIDPLQRHDHNKPFYKCA